MATGHESPQAVYVIYSADILGSAREIDSMGPFRVATRDMPYATPFPGEWTQTEGDESYDFGYLGRESGNARFFPAGYADAEGLAECEDDEPCGEGRHRKWVAELTLDEWRAVAEALVIDLDDDEIMPADYEETMGSITEYGHIPAVCVENSEGWAPMSVIHSCLYVSFATLAS